jgi:hypothetical protein
MLNGKLLTSKNHIKYLKKTSQKTFLFFDDLIVKKLGTAKGYIVEYSNPIQQEHSHFSSSSILN